MKASKKTSQVVHESTEIAKAPSFVIIQASAYRRIAHQEPLFPCVFRDSGALNPSIFL